MSLRLQGVAVSLGIGDELRFSRKHFSVTASTAEGGHYLWGNSYLSGNVDFLNLRHPEYKELLRLLENLLGLGFQKYFEQNDAVSYRVIRIDSAGPMLRAGYVLTASPIKGEGIGFLRVYPCAEDVGTLPDSRRSVCASFLTSDVACAGACRLIAHCVGMDAEIRTGPQGFMATFVRAAAP